MDNFFIPSTWRRLAAYFLDQMFGLVMYLPFAGAFVSLFFSDEDVVLSLFQVVVLFLVPALYEFVFLFLMQATPGKWLVGLKVVPHDNPTKALHIGQCILRPLTSRLSLFFGWAIYAVAFFRYDRTHLCDWVAETRVVQFQPRPHRTRIRWILGVFLIIGYAYEGLVSSSHMLQQVDWENKQVNLRSLMPEDSVNMDFGEVE